MLGKTEAALFDMDGTLIDSMWMWKSIDVEYLGRYNIELPEDLQKEIEGMSFSETAIYFKERFSLDTPLETIKSDWNQMAWDKYENEVTVKEGVFEFLDYLKAQEIKLGIATSNSVELATMVLKKRGLYDYFDAIHTSCEVPKGKPAPDIYQLVAKNLNVNPENCLVFEDVISGILAGKAAGMKVCAVYDEAAKLDDGQKKELADFYLHSFQDWRELL